MRAAMYDRYGAPDVIRVVDTPLPEPGPDQLLVRVHAAALNPKDLMVRAGKFRVISGRRFPRGVGYDWAGELVRAGVRARAPGAALFGMINGWAGNACGEYLLVRPDECAERPAGLTWEEAASVPLTALTALQALRDEARLQPGQRVLINGASGGVGVQAVQIAKLLGAHVTTLTSAGNRARVAELGADQTLDYAAAELHSLARFDVFFDVFGNASLAKTRALLEAHGTYVTTVPSARNIVDHARTFLAKQRARLVVVRSRTSDLQAVRTWLEDGRLRPVVDRVYELTQVAEAQRYLATKRARGKVVIRL